MRNKLFPRQLLILLCSLAVSSIGWADQLDEVQQWLQKMQRAAHMLNYDGTFVYGQQGQLTSMRIVHRVTPQGEQERLISMDGSGREVIRDGKKVTCILPDSKTVVVEKSRQDKQFPPPFPMRIKELSKYYNFSLAGNGKVAGQPTQRISITPKDVYRYGHILWVDRDTGLLLKTHLLDEAGKPIEQFVFTRIAYLKEVPDEWLQPAVDGRDFTWYESRDEQPLEVGDTGPDLKVAWLPNGFEQDMNRMQKLPTSAMPVKHLVFSDGLASISIFVEEALEHSQGNLEGGSRMGAVNAHGTDVGDYHVTVVGEVPHITVEKISQAVVLNK